MTWFKFICWLSGGYALYYLANILWDLSRVRKGAKPAAQELHFEEAVKPQQVQSEMPPVPKLPDKVKSPVIDSGGLRLRQLFAAAKAEIIMYTGGVTY